MKVLTPADTNDSVEVPEDFEDLRTAESVEIPFQQLLNRLTYLANRRLVALAGPVTDGALVAFDGTGGKVTKESGLVYGTDLSYATGKPRTKFINLERVGASTGWKRGTGGGVSNRLIADVNSSYAHVPLTGIPSGCIVTRVRVGVNAGTNNSGADRIQISLLRSTPNTSTGATSEAAHGSTVDDGGGTGDKILTLGSPAQFTAYTVIDGETLSLVIKSSVSSASVNDFLNWVEVQFTDIGPRNA